MTSYICRKARNKTKDYKKLYEEERRKCVHLEKTYNEELEKKNKEIEIKDREIAHLKVSCLHLQIKISHEYS